MRKDLPSLNYRTEKQQYRKLKNNLLLVLAILGLCYIIHLNLRSRTRSDSETTRQRYFDASSRPA